MAGVIIAGEVIYSLGRQSGPASSASVKDSLPTAIDAEKIDTFGDPVIGSSDAPLTLVYWLDFQCPFCKRFDLQTLPLLVSRYVNTGKMKIVFKDFQFLGPDSETGGLFERAIWELYPDKYFEWHQAMFEAQDEEGAGFGSRESIVALIKKIGGMDTNKILSLIDQNIEEYKAEMAQDQQEGFQYGVQGTPGFVIGKDVVYGAQPLAVFENVIKKNLGE